MFLLPGLTQNYYVNNLNSLSASYLYKQSNRPPINQGALSKCSLATRKILSWEVLENAYFNHLSNSIIFHLHHDKFLLKQNAEMYGTTVPPCWCCSGTGFCCHQFAAILSKESCNIWWDTKMHGYHTKSDIGTRTYLAWTPSSFVNLR